MGEHRAAQMCFASSYVANKIFKFEWHHRYDLNAGEKSRSAFLRSLGCVRSARKADWELVESCCGERGERTSVVVKKEYIFLP